MEVKVTGATPEDFTYDTLAKGNSFSDMKWEKQTYVFVATAENTTLTFSSKTTGPCGPVLDNVFVMEKETLTPILENPTETEDDNLQDQKGVADKTKFTFNVTQTGDPEIKLYVDGTEFPKVGPSWEGTFGKGTHEWYFEANKNGLATTTTETKTFMTGYSNVAFLPGLEASRLYKLDISELDGVNQLWEPNRNADVEKLYLDPITGESLDDSIYTRDIIDQANVIPDPTGLTQSNIYKGFIKFMNDDVVGKGTINEWEALPYDWRLDYDKLFVRGIKDLNGDISYVDDTNTPFILKEIERLTETSDTGKVTIIAHSNGGLFAKYLLSKLEIDEHPLLQKVDKLILVAVPQVGTPSAIEALLHGDEAQLPGGFTDIGILMDEERAREMGENMQSAYNLLPSEKYFDFVKSPVIEFNKNAPITNTWATHYGETITTADGLREFLLGDIFSGNSRTEPAPNDEESPNVLKSHFLEKAKTNHITLDSWEAPVGMEVIQIAGWGEKTVRGIKYSCGLLTCHSLSTLDREMLKTTDGDGTVVVPSALMMSTSTENVERYYVDLGEYNKWGGRRINEDHSSILEVVDVREFLQNIFLGTREHGTFIKDKKPLEENASKRLDFSIHSPVSLHLYDNKGNHTGIISNPNPDSDLNLYEAQLPNSYYQEYGEVKYAGSDTFEPTTVKLIGESLGTFTFDIEETLGDETVATATWKDIPVTKNSIITLDVQTAENVAPLSMDVDGDGTPDIKISVGEGVSPQELTSILKGIVKTLDIPEQKKARLIKKIEKLEKVLEKEFKNEQKKKQKTSVAFENLTKKISQFQKKGTLTSEEVTELLEIIEKIKGSVVK